MNEPPSPQEVDEATRRRLSPAELKASRRIGETWALTPYEVASLLGMTSAEYDQALVNPEEIVLRPAQFYRAGLLISIFGALRQLFDPPLADRWPGRPNTGLLFGGRSAVKLMQEGGVESMKDVLKYLGAVGQGL